MAASPSPPWDSPGWESSCFPHTATGRARTLLLPRTHSEPHEAGLALRLGPVPTEAICMSGGVGIAPLLSPSSGRLHLLGEGIRSPRQRAWLSRWPGAPAPAPGNVVPLAECAPSVPLQGQRLHDSAKCQQLLNKRLQMKGFCARK